MNREGIIRMAQEAGFFIQQNEIYSMSTQSDQELTEWIERFAALVASAAVRETSAEYRMGWNDGQIAEREACAKVCEEQMQGKSIWVEGARACSLAIRERGGL